MGVFYLTLVRHKLLLDLFLLLPPLLLHLALVVVELLFPLPVFLFDGVYQVLFELLGQLLDLDILVLKQGVVVLN